MFAFGTLLAFGVSPRQVLRSAGVSAVMSVGLRAGICIRFFYIFAGSCTIPGMATSSACKIDPSIAVILERFRQSPGAHCSARWACPGWVRSATRARPQPDATVGILCALLALVGVSPAARFM